MHSHHPEHFFNFHHIDFMNFFIFLEQALSFITQRFGLNRPLQPQLHELEHHHQKQQLLPEGVTSQAGLDGVQAYLPLAYSGQTLRLKTKG